MTHTTFRPNENQHVQHHLVGRHLRTPDGTLAEDVPEIGPFPPKQSTDDYGGGGLYSSAEDYIKILRSLLLDDGVLLKPETVAELFRPQLQDTTYIQAIMDVPQAAAFLAPSYGAGHKWNYALGGAVATEGIEGRMDVGAMQWAGMPNSYWVSLSSWPFFLSFLSAENLTW
jgi:CubicO group peptidase (beta-lactamase class C family)